MNNAVANANDTKTVHLFDAAALIARLEREADQLAVGTPATERSRVARAARIGQINAIIDSLRIAVAGDNNTRANWGHRTATVRD